MNENIDELIQEIAAKDAKVLCREVLSITDTRCASEQMDGGNPYCHSLWEHPFQGYAFSGSWYQ